MSKSKTPKPGSQQQVVRDRQVWIRSRGGNPDIVGKGYPLCELMTKQEAVEETKLWPRKFYAVRTRIVPNTCVSDGPADAPELTRSAEGPFAARNG